MRDVCVFSEDEVVPLSKYQEEDLNQETDELYQNVIKIQGALPSVKFSDNDKMKNAAEELIEYLKGRVMFKPARIALLLATCLVLLTFIPSFIPAILEKKSDYAVLFIVFVVIMVVIICSSIFVLLVQKYRVNQLVKKYNQLIQNEYNKLSQSAGDYSAYMTNIASHSRGRSYYNHSTIMKKSTNTERYSKVKHIKAINILLGRLANWSKAYHLNVDFDSKRPEVSMEFDLSAAPIENKIYSFEVSKRYQVAINNI